MENSGLAVLAADTILGVHILFVLFVVLGLLLVFVGNKLSWGWVRNPWFRVVHLLAIGAVVIQAWLGMRCPLTIWEMNLRARAGDVTYPGSFIAHWLDFLLYYQAPFWVFTVVYTIFGLVVIASWVWVRPRKFFS